MDGGKFGSAFASGFAASAIGTYAREINLNFGLMTVSTMAIGGSVAWATGGNFIQGATQGLAIALLNHQVHERRLYDRQIKKIYNAYIKTSWRIKSNHWEIVSAKELCEQIGGDLAAIKDDVRNSCAIRLSLALNEAGYDIPNVNGTMEGEDGKGYFLKAEDFNKYLCSKDSPVRLVAVISNPNYAKNGLAYMFPGKEWQNQSITGHVDIVYRGNWASHVNVTDYYGGSPYDYMYRTNIFH